MLLFGGMAFVIVYLYEESVYSLFTSNYRGIAFPGTHHVYKANTKAVSHSMVKARQVREFSRTEHNISI